MEKLFDVFPDRVTEPAAAAASTSSQTRTTDSRCRAENRPSRESSSAMGSGLHRVGVRGVGAGGGDAERVDAGGDDVRPPRRGSVRAVGGEGEDGECGERA